MADAIIDVERAVGPRHAIVAHSFGAAAVLLAHQRGAVDAARNVMIAPGGHLARGQAPRDGGPGPPPDPARRRDRRGRPVRRHGIAPPASELVLEVDRLLAQGGM